MALVEALPFSYLHVFAYSDRAGTEAAARRATTSPPRTIATPERDAARAGDGEEPRVPARDASATTEDVLVLETRDRATGGLVGLTGNYVEVTFDGPDALMRTLTRVRVTAGVEPTATRGEVAA